jgi:hypothetical protein
MSMVRGLLVAALLLAGFVGSAAANTDGLVLRAVGWYKGSESISNDGIRCEVPSVSSAIGDGLFTMGLWNTFGNQTIQFPDRNSPFANPCGGWIQMWNSMTMQGINLNRINISYRIGGARRFNGSVSQQRGWPTACNAFRRTTLFAGTRLGPNDPDAPDNSTSGLPNVAFLQVLPMIPSSVFFCLREQYGPLPPDVYTDLPLIVKARIQGYGDNGDAFKSNVIKYTLNLRHTCGNGRLDDGEDCDTSASGTPCSGFAVCVSNVCFGDPTRGCNTDADCIGTCQAAGSVEECTCTY